MNVRSVMSENVFFFRESRGLSGAAVLRYNPRAIYLLFSLAPSSSLGLVRVPRHDQTHLPLPSLATMLSPPSLPRQLFAESRPSPSTQVAHATREREKEKDVVFPTL